MNILHLTHTDINSDSRILKEMNTVANFFNEYRVVGIGIGQNEESHKTKTSSKIEIYSILLRSRNWEYLPRVIRHTYSLIELTYKMLYKALKIKPQIIHCHDTLVLPLGVIVKFFTGSKLIYDAHELESDRNGLTKTLGNMTLFTEKLLFKLIDRLIVVSPSILKWYNKNIGEKPAEIILNSPILKQDIYDRDKLYFRQKFSIPENLKIFLYIGGFSRGRGIDLVIEAFKKKDVSSHVIFLGYGQLKDKLVDLSSHYSNIHVHDAVPHEEVVSIARSTDVGLCFIENVSLSDYYCLPNKLFEYVFAEIPVLASNFPDISSVMSKYNLGKCSDLDPESIYKAIKEFELMKKLPKINSQDLYDLSWGMQEKKLINLYQSVMQEIKKEKK